MITVSIYRTEGFFNTSQPGAAAFMASAKMSIGGYWASASSKAIGTGLTPTEQNILLPLVLDMHPDDREFRKTVREFYEALTTKVPYSTGVTLKIELEDPSKPLSITNLPKEAMDYIRWKHALGHPDVAADKEAAAGDMLKKFYVHDPSTVKDKKADLRKLKEEAMAAYLALSKDETKVDNVLALLGEDPRGFKDLSEKLEFLQTRSASADSEELKTFTETAGDNQLEIKSFIKKLALTGVLRTVGTRYLVEGTNEVLGNDLEETVLELQDEEKNSELIVVLKAKLQDQMKKKIARLKSGK